MFKSSAYGLMMAAVLLSTPVLAGPVKMGSQSTAAGATKQTFSPLVGIVPLGPKVPRQFTSRHFPVGGTAAITLQPYCVAPRVAVPYCVRRGPGAHGKCEETVWRCELNGAADVDPDRQ